MKFSIRKLDVCISRCLKFSKIFQRTKQKLRVRWNACYAVSNMFKNPLLNHNNSEMMKELIITLCSVVKDCKNFKVRINAAVALGAPTLRTHYGDVSLYRHVWESLVKGLQTAEEITEFGEFRYRNQLNNQICSSLLHLVVVLELSDLDSLQPLLEREADVIAEHFDRFRTITAENAPVYDPEAAKVRVTELLQSASWDHKSLLDKITSVCLLEEDHLDRKTEKSAFLQTYD